MHWRMKEIRFGVKNETVKNKTTITLVLMISGCVLSSLVQTALNTGISPIKEEPFLEIRMYALTAVLFGIAVVKIK